MKKNKKTLLGIIMGSDSDLPVMQEAAKVLEDFGIKYEITIVSAHRTPERMFKYAKQAEKRGIEVIIAGAGGAAHLPGMTASLTPLPVIGVPIKTTSLKGTDSLLSIMQMPGGVPVATVAINNAKNAGILAVEILGIKYPEIKKKVKQYKERLKKEVKEKAKELTNVGYEKYVGVRQNGKNMKGIFATAINCMDGRVQIPVIEWLKRRYSVNYVDMITEPGPNKILSENKDRTLVESIKKRVEISVMKHNSKLITLVGHYDCAGNPVEKETQIKQIYSAIKTIKSWNFEVQIIGLWINENWEVYEVEAPVKLLEIKKLKN